MIRQILTVLLPLAAPSILYFLWLRFRRDDPENRKPPPWLWLAGIGAVLAIVSLLAVGIHTSGSPYSGYTPARLENGVLIPGKITDPAEGADR